MTRSALLICSWLLIPPQSLQAAEPLPYHIVYTAKYNSFSAEAERSLIKSSIPDQWQLNAKVALKLFGSTVSSIEEISDFAIQQDKIAFQTYRFQQRGIGSRSRSLTFNKETMCIDFVVDNNSGSLAMPTQTFDSLTSQLQISQAVAAGASTVAILVADRNQINAQQYEVLETQPLMTAQGIFASVHVRRKREGENSRQTEFWLARDFDYVLLKLVQKEPDGDKLTLEIRHGTVANRTLTGSKNPDQ